MKHNTKKPARDRSHLNKPKVSFKVDDDMSSGKESDSGTALPIVELKPFVQKVWRREKSLPSFYQKNEGPQGSGRTSTGSKSKEPEVEVEIKPEDSVSPPPLPPRTSHSLPSSLPSQRLLQFQANSLFDNASAKDFPVSGSSLDSGFRPKSRIHPPVEPKTQHHPEHSVSLIPGALTREDREKTTVNDITDGDLGGRAYSCSPKNFRPQEMRRHQNMKVTGENVTRVLHPKVYNVANSWRASGTFQGVRHGSPASMLYFHRPSYEKPKMPGAHVYDNLDRKGVLPSLTVHSKSIKKRLPQYDENEDYRDYRDTYEASTRYHVGGIENSLKCLSEQGEPTKIERMLTFHLELNLSRFRTCKDYSPLETSPAELAKYYSTPTFNLTQGEVDIRKGLMSNTSKRKRGNQRNADPLSKEGFAAYSTVPEFQKLQSRKSRIFDHLKALENKLPEYAVYERNDSRGMSTFERDRADYTMTDDELLVPNDTPRTQIDSRVSFKPTEVPIEEQSRETLTNSSDTCTSLSGLRTNEQNKENVLKPSKDKVVVQSTPRKDKMNPRLQRSKTTAESPIQVRRGLEFDKDGKTFITSDSRTHITVSG